MDIFEKLESGEAVDMYTPEYRPAVAELHRSYQTFIGAQIETAAGVKIPLPPSFNLLVACGEDSPTFRHRDPWSVDGIVSMIGCN